MKTTGFHLFTYGTLQVPEIMQVVAGTAFASTEAYLENYCRYSIKNAVYPAVIAQPGKMVSGKLYSGLSNSDLRRIDLFEDVIYIRQNCKAMVHDRGLISAYVYVLADAYRHELSDKPWCLETFRQNEFESYLAGCQRFSECFV